MSALLCAAVAGVFFSNAAFSQSTAPSTVEPGQIEKSFEPKIKPATSPDEVVKPIQEPDSGADNEVKFKLNSVTISGNTVLSDEELAGVYSRYIGQSVSFRDLNAIANDVTEKYKQSGYVLARAFIPPQKVSGGTVEIKVIEGFIDQISIQGQIEGDRSLLDAYVEKIKAVKPLRTSTLERYMLLMDDLPGVTARGLLRPSKQTIGAADLIISISHDKTEVDLEANNRGTRYLGPYQLSATVRANSWNDRYERTTVRYVTTSQTNELKFFDASYSEPVGTDGATVSGSFVRSKSKPGSNIKSLDLDSDNNSVGLEYVYPVIRSREENFFTRVNATMRQTVTDSVGARLTKDDVRVARVGAQYDKVDSFEGVNLADLELSQGLDVFNATDNNAGASRTSADADFTKAVLNLSRYQPFMEKFAVLVSATGQYASGSLFASEEMGLGGSGFGSAYDPSEITGDHGAAGKAELQYSKYAGQEYLSSYQLYSFFDGGVVWNDNAASGESKRATLTSAGVGTRLYFNDTVSGQLELAVPLTRDVASEGAQGDNPRMFFSLAKRF